MLKQIDIDSPKPIKPASSFVTGHNRDGSFYIRERRSRRMLNVTDERIETAIATLLIVLGGFCLLLLLA